MLFISEIFQDFVRVNQCKLLQYALNGLMLIEFSIVIEARLSVKINVVVEWVEIADARCVQEDLNVEFHLDFFQKSL